MGVTRKMLADLERLLRPLSNRVANSIARAVVSRVTDASALQGLQIEVLRGETRDNAERFQQYGFSSVPLEGAEAVVLFPNGNRTHPLVVAVDDRRYRPTGRPEGEVNVYHHTGSRMRMLASGDVEVVPAPGGHVYVRSEGGSTDRLVTRTEFNAHTHPVSGVTAGAAAVTSAEPTTPATGTSVLRAE